MKYLIIAVSSFLLEIGSTMYISSVADKHLYGTIFWSFLAPFIALPFSGYIADSTWKERVYLAFASAFGYSIGAYVTMQIII